VDNVIIVIVRNKIRQTAELLCNLDDVSIIFSLDDGYKKSYTGPDFYQCFGQIREDHSDIIFLCKGAKLNVHPSRMSSQMSKGLLAYELKIGTPSDEDDLVRIFDYDDENITNSINDQRAFYKIWIESLASQKPNPI